MGWGGEQPSILDDFGHIKDTGLVGEEFEVKHLQGILPASTLPKTNMDTQNDGLEKVTPFKHGNCWYLC